MRILQTTSYVLLLLLLIVSGCAIQKGKWQKALNENTIEAYTQFLKEYPSSEYVSEAQSRIEDLSYSQASRTNTVEAFESFLERFPRGTHSEEARGTFNNLQIQRIEEAERQAEASAYDEFSAKPSIKSAAKYLRIFPKGKQKVNVYKWLREQHVAFSLPDSNLLVSLLEHRDIPQMEVSTGEMLFGPGQKFTQVTKVVKPTVGNRFLNLRLEITNVGSIIRLQRKNFQLITNSSVAYSPIFWFQEVVMLSMRGESFDLKDSIRVNAVFDVPKDESLVLFVDGKRFASLTELKQK